MRVAGLLSSSMQETAQFVVSIDLEMSWGAVHHGYPHDAQPYRAEREVVADVLSAMEIHGISATWAVVGHLFLAECAPQDGVKHPSVVRPHYPWLEGDWYDLDPASSLDAAPTWYGSDLVQAIKLCSTPQEIASHSFGHVIVGEEGCSPEAFRTDLTACHEVAAEAGVELRSFVFPRNSVGHLSVLEECGFTAFRGPTPVRFADASIWRRRILSAVDTMRPMKSAAVHATTSHGMANIPHTYMFDPGSRTAQQVGTKAWSYLVRRRLRHAVRTSSLFHLWFHTHNLAVDRPRAQRGLHTVFGEARKHIDAGRLENLTMVQLADRMGGAHEPAR